MVSVTASTLSNILPDDSDLTATIAEYIIDQSIDLLNLFSGTDEDLDNMSGTAGSMTVTVDGYERGAINMVARIIYYSFFKGQIGASSGLGPASETDTADLLANPVVLKVVERASQLMATRRTDMDEIEVDTG